MYIIILVKPSNMVYNMKFETLSCILGLYSLLLLMYTIYGKTFEWVTFTIFHSTVNNIFKFYNLWFCQLATWVYKHVTVKVKTIFYSNCKSFTTQKFSHMWYRDIILLSFVYTNMIMEYMYSTHSWTIVNGHTTS